MRVAVSNYSEFLSSVYNYIIEYHEIVPRDFEGAFVPGIGRSYGIVGDNDDDRPINNSEGRLFFESDTDGFGTALRYTLDGKLETFVCPFYRKSLHVHDDDRTFCSEPELLALRYIMRSVFSPKKPKIIETLKDWLPTVTIDSVHVRFDLKDFDRDTDVVRSDLSPAYCLHFLQQDHSKFDTLTYYFISNIVPEGKGVVHESEYEITQEPQEENNVVAEERSLLLLTRRNPKRVMVRRRSRSRSRSSSRGASGGSGGRRRKRSCRRRKSRSPSRSRCRSRSSSSSRRTSSRRRSRSRSRSPR